MVYKSAIVNLISIWEAMVLECANQICCCPSICKMNKKCKYSFNRSQRDNSFEAIKRINDLGVTSFSSKELDRIKELVDLRNCIHIRLDKEKEMTDKNFNLRLYNEVIKLLQQTCMDLSSNATMLYNHCRK